MRDFAKEWVKVCLVGDIRLDCFGDFLGRVY